LKLGSTIIFLEEVGRVLLRNYPGAKQIEVNISHLQQECHKSKFGVFELLV